MTMYTQSSEPPLLLMVDEEQLTLRKMQDPSQWTQQQAIAWGKILDLMDHMIQNEQDPVKYERYSKRYKKLRDVMLGVDD